MENVPLPRIVEVGIEHAMSHKKLGEVKFHLTIILDYPWSDIPNKSGSPPANSHLGLLTLLTPVHISRILLPPKLCPLPFSGKQVDGYDSCCYQHCSS